LDVLSEFLRVVTLNGALFYNAEFSAPWCFRSPASRTLAPHLGPGAGHVIIYHLVVDGAAWAAVEKDLRVDLGPGDIVVFPHGDPHEMGNGRAVEPVDHGRELDRVLSQGLEVVRTGGGGEVTRIVCGYMSCDPHYAQLLLGGLPPLFKVNIRNDPAGAWLETSIRFSVAQAGSPAAGAGAVVAKLSEVLFMETLRRYIAMLPPGQTGWLAGARDRDVGAALALLHRQPARPWTIGDLAAEVGLSRAVLAERFRHFLGQAPIGYLMRWRMQLGARLLTKTSRSIAGIAAEVGYDSEAAFNRAFKREFGVPPARFRKDSRTSGAKGVAAGSHHR
jgi:AraC-like DNA-binding protein